MKISVSMFIQGFLNFFYLIIVGHRLQGISQRRRGCVNGMVFTLVIGYSVPIFLTHAYTSTTCIHWLAYAHTMRKLWNFTGRFYNVEFIAHKEKGEKFWGWSSHCMPGRELGSLGGQAKWDMISHSLWQMIWQEGKFVLLKKQSFQFVK